MANYNIVEKVEMCSDDCCGKPITECVCGPDCEHCDCHAKNNINESYSDDDDNRTVSNCCGADAYIRHNEISVGDTSRCSDCREMAEFIPEKDFFESTVSEDEVKKGDIINHRDLGKIKIWSVSKDGKEYTVQVGDSNNFKKMSYAELKGSVSKKKFSTSMSEEDVTVDNAGNIAGYLDTIDDYVEQVFMIDDQTRSEDIKEMAHRIQNAVDDIRIRELKIQPSNLRQNFESSNLGEDEVTRIKELAGIFKSSVEESKELDEIAPLVPLAVGAAAAATGAIAYKAGNLIHKGVSKIKKNLSDYGKGTSNPANEETVNEEHDIDILKAVAQQMEADAHTGDFTAIEELLQDIPQENLEAFLTDHRSKNEYPEENIQPAVETVEQNEEKGNE